MLCLNKDGFLENKTIPFGSLIKCYLIFNFVLCSHQTPRLGMADVNTISATNGAVGPGSVRKQQDQGLMYDCQLSYCSLDFQLSMPVR